MKTRIIWKHPLFYYISQLTASIQLISFFIQLVCISIHLIKVVKNKVFVK